MEFADMFIQVEALAKEVEEVKDPKEKEKMESFMGELRLELQLAQDVEYEINPDRKIRKKKARSL